MCDAGSGYELARVSSCTVSYHAPRTTYWPDGHCAMRLHRDAGGRNRGCCPCCRRASRDNRDRGGRNSWRAYRLVLPTAASYQSFSSRSTLRFGYRSPARCG